MATGIFIGKFMPLHKGHERSIIEAYTKCDKLYILLCFRSTDPIPRYIREYALSKFLLDLDNADYMVIYEPADKRKAA
jgi:HTH-type transcriptional repressor of NAD biosynthesis genes